MYHRNEHTGPMQSQLTRFGSRLAGLGTELDDLILLGSVITADAISEYRGRLELVNEKSRNAHEKLNQLRQGGVASLSTLQGGCEEACHEFAVAVQTFKS